VISARARRELNVLSAGPAGAISARSVGSISVRRDLGASSVVVVVVVVAIVAAAAAAVCDRATRRTTRRIAGAPSTGRSRRSATLDIPYLPGRHLPGRHLPRRHLPRRHLPRRLTSTTYLGDLPRRLTSATLTSATLTSATLTSTTYLDDLPRRHFPRRHLPRRLTSATLTSAVSSPRLPISVVLAAAWLLQIRSAWQAPSPPPPPLHVLLLLVVMMYHPPADSAPRSSQFRPTPRSDAARSSSRKPRRVVYAINPILINN